MDTLFAENMEQGKMPDIYTKSLLTIIAAALVVIAAQQFVRSADAQREIQRVQICDTMGCVKLSPIYTKSGGMGITGWALAVAPEQ
jgi:hypothetical protein